jgi:hypothetical protein
MTMSRTHDSDDTIRKRSGWLIPLGVFAVTFALSALFLLFYLVPAPPALFQEQVAPTSRTDVVSLQVRGLKLAIPANYLEYNSARQGGSRKSVELFAMLPDMGGWSNWDAQSFTNNLADSPIVYLVVHDDVLNLSEADRLQRIYFAYVVDPKGSPGPFGLTQYVFRNDSGYRSEDLFVGNTQAGPVVLRCVRFSAEVPSPSCLREQPLGRGVSLSYRFKRAHLGEWQEIGAGVDKLIKSFEHASK